MMEINGQPNFSDDQVSRYQNFCSNHHLSGQPRKISIGILMDSFSKKSVHKVLNAEDSLIPTNENVTPRKVNSAEDGKKTGGVLCTASKQEKMEALIQETSPWLSTRSFNQRLPTQAQVQDIEMADILPSTSPITEVHNRLHVPVVSPANSSVHLFADHMSRVEPSQVSQRKFDGDMSGVKDRTEEGVEQLTFTTIQKVVPEKEMVEDKATKVETRGSETLRMKLWEILETISSPNQQHLSDSDLGVGAKNMKSMQKSDVEGNPVVKPGQKSDTVESDSEGHDHSVRRLRTHSLTKNGASGELRATKSCDAHSTLYKKENQEKDASFTKMFSASGSSIVFMRNNSEKYSVGIDTRTMCSREHENPVQEQQVKNRSKRRLSLEKSTLHRKEVGDGNGPYKWRKNDFTDPKNASLYIDSYQVHVTEVLEHLRNVDSPKLKHNVDLQEDVGYTFLKSISKDKFDISSPSFGANTPKERSPDFPPSEMRNHAARSSPGSLLETELGEAHDNSPVKMMSNTGVFRSFKSFLASKLTCDKSDSLPKPSYDPEGSEDSSPSHIKLRYTVEESRSRLPISSYDGSDSETLKEDSHAKGVEDNSKLLQHLEFNQGNELASAVTLFALALERVKSKIKSVVRKRSAEILMSVAEGIHGQLQTAKVQIQADMGKLTSLNKTKRKHSEMRFQELQGQLTAIHAKFKEEVHRHIQYCRDTVEGLDAHQMELRGSVEKQSASHRKLLFQAEEAIETQLNDARRRITEISDLAREKMLQLKNVVANCLNESNFG